MTRPEKRMRCLYCAKVFACKIRPRRCPACKAVFSLTVGPKTTTADLVRATEKNASAIEFSLAT